jgi:hypothetical protein
MDILERINDVLVEQDPQERDSLLDQLSQALKYHHGLNESDVVEGV